MRKIYAQVALLMALIVILSAGITAFTGTVRPQSQRLRVVATFYPVYIAALNVAGGADGVEVQNLVGAQTGCLHDYQLSPDNLMTIEGADVLVMNGAGAEPFLDPVLAAHPELPVVDTSEGVPLLESGHLHQHGEEAEPAHGDVDEHGINEHIWMSPTRYIQQVENLRDGLYAADPSHADAYARNADAYIAQIRQVWTQLQEAAAGIPYRHVVTFHDSLSYLAEDLNWEVVAALSVGEEDGVSANDLSAAYDAVSGAGDVLFLYDTQYPSLTYDNLTQAAARGATVWVDTAVGGPDSPDAWLQAMTKTAQALFALA